MNVVKRLHKPTTFTIDSLFDIPQKKQIECKFAVRIKICHSKFVIVPITFLREIITLILTIIIYT